MTDEHHAEAILRAAVPVAFLYEREGQIFTSHNPGSIMFMESDGWTETQLYPASAILDAVQAERAAIVAWLRDTPRGMLEYEEFYANAIERGEHLPQDKPQ